MVEPEMIVSIKTDSVNINQQVLLIDVKYQQDYSNLEKMLENL